MDSFQPGYHLWIKSCNNYKNACRYSAASECLEDQLFECITSISLSVRDYAQHEAQDAKSDRELVLELNEEIHLLTPVAG